MAFLLSFSITRPINKLNEIAKSVAKGSRNKEIELDDEIFKGQDEISNLADSFKMMLGKLKSTIKAANDKNREFEQLAHKESLRSWHSEGLSIFNEILRNNHADLETQTFDIISQLVKYTKSIQGGIFVVNRDNQHDIYLELRGCYAYERKKYQKKRVDLGEGLIGTVWQRGQAIAIDEIPDDYVKISSGLGKAKPKSLLIVPLRSDEQIEGVIELLSFQEYKEYELEFIEALSLRIGNALVSLKATAKTKELLEQSEKNAKDSREKENYLEKQIENYQFWVQQFETKLNHVSEEASIYQAILNNVYSGMIITDEQFRIKQINQYITKRFDYQKNELVGKSIDIIIEAEYENIIDLKDKKFKLNFNSFRQNSFGKIIDKRGVAYDVQTMTGKLELGERMVYVFLFNEIEEKQTSSETRLKVAS